MRWRRASGLGKRVGSGEEDGVWVSGVTSGRGAVLARRRRAAAAARSRAEDAMEERKEAEQSCKNWGWNYFFGEEIGDGFKAQVCNTRLLLLLRAQ